MTHITRFIPVGFLTVLIFAAAVALAEVDPTKALIGTWQGQIEISQGNNGRTLIINSVKAKGEGEWAARGRYGFADQVSKDGSGQAMSVSSKDNEVFVEFLSPGAKNPVRLKLVGDNKLEGTTDMGGKIGNRRIKFEKVETKAGEVK